MGTRSNSRKARCRTWKSFLQIIPVVLALMFTTGCAAIFDEVLETAIDSAIETSSEKQIRTDNRRLAQGKPLKYHKNERQLRAHETQEILDDVFDDDDDDE